MTAAGSVLPKKQIYILFGLPALYRAMDDALNVPWTSPLRVVGINISNNIIYQISELRRSIDTSFTPSMARYGKVANQGDDSNDDTLPRGHGRCDSLSQVTLEDGLRFNSWRDNGDSLRPDTDRDVVGIKYQRVCFRVEPSDK